MNRVAVAFLTPQGIRKKQLYLTLNLLLKSLEKLKQNPKSASPAKRVSAAGGNGQNIRLKRAVTTQNPALARGKN